MTILAYSDFRPDFFLGGLPVFILLAILVCRLANVKLGMIPLALIASIIFAVLFAFFLTGFGPFVDQKETRKFQMTWEIQPPPSDSKITQSKVVFTFVEFPNDHTYHYSDELAEHLKSGGQEKVNVVFDVTLDYDKVRGFHELEIAGLKEWKIDPEGQGGSSTTGGDQELSPWD